MNIKAKNFASILLLTGLALSAQAATIADQSGSANPTTNGFVIPSIWNGATSLGPVTNDLGLGINAWNVQGNWCCTGYEYSLNTAEESALAANNWVLTVQMRNLSTSTATNGYGPNSLGDGVFVGIGGLRYQVELHADGQGNQVLAADPFAANETYTIKGLGTNYATIQLAYDAATKTADYYVNGTEVLSGISGFSNFYEPWVAFGGQDGNFSLVELQSDTSITPPTSAPEPTTYTLFGIGALLVGGLRRRRRESAH